MHPKRRVLRRKERKYQSMTVFFSCLLYTSLSPFYFVVSLKLVTDGILRGCGMMVRFMIATFSDLIDVYKRQLRIPAERVRTYAEKWKNFTISGCSFMVECGILGLAQ